MAHSRDVRGRPEFSPFVLPPVGLPASGKGVAATFDLAAPGAIQNGNMRFLLLLPNVPDEDREPLYDVWARWQGKEA